MFIEWRKLLRLESFYLFFETCLVELQQQNEWKQKNPKKLYEPSEQQLQSEGTQKL